METKQVKEIDKVQGLGRILLSEPKCSSQEEYNDLKKAGVCLSTTRDKIIEAGAEGIITARDLAYTRSTYAGKENEMPERIFFGNYVKEGAIYSHSKNSALFLADSSFLLNKYTIFSDNYPVVENNLVNKYFEMAQEDKEKPIKERRVLEVPLSNFSSGGNGWDKTDMPADLKNWLFKDQVESYEKFKKEPYQVMIADRGIMDKQFNPIWMRSCQKNSEAVFLNNNSYTTPIWAIGVKK